MARPRTNDEAVRGRLLAAATELLAERAAEAVTVRAVAEHAESSAAAIYTLFGGRAELLAEATRAAAEGLVAALGAVPPTDDAHADIRDLARVYRTWALGNRHLYQALFRGARRTNPQGDPQATDPAAPLVAAVRRAIAQGVVAGDPTEVALTCWSVVHGVVSLELDGALADSVSERVFDAAVAAIVRGWSPA